MKDMSHVKESEVSQWPFGSWGGSKVDRGEAANKEKQIWKTS